MSSRWGIVNGWWPGFGPAVLVAADEHREVDDPDVAVRTLVHRRTAEVVAQLAEHLARRRPLVGDDEHEVAGCGADAASITAAASSAERNLATGESNEPSSATFSHTRPLAPSDLARSVSLSSWLRPYSAAAPGTRMPLIAAAPANALNSVAGEDVGELDELHAEAQVGLVDAEAVHRLVPRDPLDRRRALAVTASAASSTASLIAASTSSWDDEAHLGIELHELVLPVGAQVLVAQAAGDLEVAVDAGDHQQLLEQLRRLRQGVERAGLLARRHEELAGALGRRRHQHRRLDLDEALRLHRPADRPS